MNYLIRSLLAAVCLLWALPENATASVACVNRKTGILRVAEKCKKTETRVSATALAQAQTAIGGSVQGPKGDQGPPGPQGPKGDPGPAGTGGGGSGGIRVFDSNSQFLGYAVYEENKILVPSLRAIAQIQTDEWLPDTYGDIPLFDAGALEYPTGDCSGPAYYFGNPTPYLARKDGRVYVVTPRPFMKIQVLSVRLESRCTTVNYIAMRTPDFDFTEVALPFATPVLFPLRFE